MKRNVDLSENRIFTTPEEPPELFKILLNVLKEIKPWNFERNYQEIRNDVEIHDLSNFGKSFAVGNKKQRQIWKRNHASDRNEICDWCGQDRGKKPWAKNRCNCYSMISTSKIPWKF